MTAKKDMENSTSATTEAVKADAPASVEELANPAPKLASKTGVGKAPASKSKTAKAAKGKQERKAAKKQLPAKAASKTTESSKAKAANAKATKPKAPKPLKTEKLKNAEKPKTEPIQTARLLDSQVAYEGKLFRVLRDHLIEPDGRESHRDVIRHNGSVVILAIDHGKKKSGKSKKETNKKDPWVVIERQYRHAAGQYLWELPAGKLDLGEMALAGAQRELAEETGYSAKKWSPLVEYFASPGFLGEAMKVFLAEGLIAGDAHPEEDEHIDFRLVKLSELLDLIDKGKIIDGKTLTSILLYARRLRVKRSK